MVSEITGWEPRSQPAAIARCRLSDFQPPQLSVLQPPLTSPIAPLAKRSADAPKNRAQHEPAPHSTRSRRGDTMAVTRPHRGHTYGTHRHDTTAGPDHWALHTADR